MLREGRPCSVLTPQYLEADLKVAQESSLYFCGLLIQFLLIKDKVYSEIVLAKKIVHNLPSYCESVFPFLQAHLGCPVL